MRYLHCTIIFLIRNSHFDLYYLYSNTTFKNCFYYRYTFESVEQLDEMTKQYINWYNYVRPHSTNNYMTQWSFDIEHDFRTKCYQKA
ncbi:integrase core domain-containing protein [Blautia glucerasea]